jgi:arylsulfatase A-like enzyme
LPTLLEISNLPVPSAAQGSSLLPLFAGGALGSESRPAFAERTPAPAEFGAYETNREIRAVIHDGWKLVLHLDASREQVELFRHRDDPLNLTDLSSENPEIVRRLRGLLDAWHREARAARVGPASDRVSMSAEEIERLRSLGYLQ